MKFLMVDALNSVDANAANTFASFVSCAVLAHANRCARVLDLREVWCVFGSVDRTLDLNKTDCA